MEESHSSTYQAKEEVRRLQALIGVHSVKNVVGESVYSVAMWNIYCESVR